MARPLVPAELWAVVQPLLPRPRARPGKRGRPPLDDRACLTGIVFVLHSGIPWEMLPQEMGCGSGMTCWRRLRSAPNGHGACRGEAHAAVGRRYAAGGQLRGFGGLDTCRAAGCIIGRGQLLSPVTTSAIGPPSWRSSWVCRPWGQGEEPAARGAHALAPLLPSPARVMRCCDRSTSMFTCLMILAPLLRGHPYPDANGASGARRRARRRRCGWPVRTA